MSLFLTVGNKSLFYRVGNIRCNTRRNCEVGNVFGFTWPEIKVALTRSDMYVGLTGSEVKVGFTWSKIHVGVTGTERKF